MSRALLAIYPGDPETNVGALFRRYLTDNAWTTWETWVDECTSTAGVDHYGDAAFVYWSALP